MPWPSIFDGSNRRVLSQAFKSGKTHPIPSSVKSASDRLAITCCLPVCASALRTPCHPYAGFAVYGVTSLYGMSCQGLESLTPPLPSNPTTRVRHQTSHLTRRCHRVMAQRRKLAQLKLHTHGTGGGLHDSSRGVASATIIRNFQYIESSQ